MERKNQSINARQDESDAPGNHFRNNVHRQCVHCFISVGFLHINIVFLFVFVIMHVNRQKLYYFICAMLLQEMGDHDSSKLPIFVTLNNSSVFTNRLPLSGNCYPSHLFKSITQIIFGFLFHFLLSLCPVNVKLSKPPLLIMNFT